MNVTARTTTTRIGNAGRHDKHLPAGTAVTFDAGTIHPSGWVRATVVGRPRINVYVHADQIEVA